MVAMTPKDYGIYYVSVALRNGQSLTFIEASTSINEAYNDVCEELYKESWDALLVVEGSTMKEVFSGDVRMREACEKELKLEYPQVFKTATESVETAKTNKAKLVPAGPSPISSVGKPWYPSPVVKFSKSGLATKLSSHL